MGDGGGRVGWFQALGFGFGSVFRWGFGRKVGSLGFGGVGGVSSGHVGSSFCAIGFCLRRFQDRVQPQDETEHALVETIAAARWRILRIQYIERTNLNLEIDKICDGRSTLDTTNEGRATVAYRNLSGGQLTPQMLAQHEARLDRQMARTVNLLLKKQNWKERTQDVIDSTDLLV